MNVFLLLVGLGLILGGAHFLTDGAAALAQRFRVPEFIVGLTVVAIGTSTPELVVSVLSSIGGQSDMAVGNVVGSNLFNVFVILGICALIRPLQLSLDNIRRDIPFGLGASVLLFLFASDRWLHLGPVARIGRGEGIAMLLLYGALLWFTIRTTPRDAAADEAAGRAAPKALWITILFVVVGLGGLVGGGELFLRHATLIARRLGVGESVIAITLVAGGTSLPELASSVVSLVKGKAGLALGNVLGSNVANILLILGVSSAIRPLTLGGITAVDLAMVVLGALLPFVAAFTFRRRSIDRWEGAVFLAIYAAYIGYLYSRSL